MAGAAVPPCGAVITIMPRGVKRPSTAARQERALTCLLQGMTHAAVCEETGVSDRQLTRWLNDEAFRDFQDELRRRQTALTEATMRRMQSRMNDAPDILWTIAHDPSATSSARVSAAKALIELGMRLSEATDILERLDALERLQTDEGDYTA